MSEIRIGAFEAKSKLGQLVDWVKAGKAVSITRRGRVVARLSSLTRSPSTSEPGT
jgi:prevent-host-death family protein